MGLLLLCVYLNRAQNWGWQHNLVLVNLVACERETSAIELSPSMVHGSEADDMMIY